MRKGISSMTQWIATYSTGIDLRWHPTVHAATELRGTALFLATLTQKPIQAEAAEKVECFFSPENLIIEMIPDFVLFGIIFSILARLFLSKCAF